MFWIHAQCISMYEIRPNLPGPDMLQLCGLGTPMSVSQVWIEVNPPIPSNPIHKGWSCSVQASHQPSFSWMYIFFCFFPFSVRYPAFLHKHHRDVGFSPLAWAFPASSMRDVVDVCVAVASEVAPHSEPSCFWGLRWWTTGSSPEEAT